MQISPTILRAAIHAETGVHIVMDRSFVCFMADTIAIDLSLSALIS
jgi:hypothetical protein